MKPSRISLFMGILFSCFLGKTDVFSCTTFTLQTEKGLYYVHSLNQGNIESLPGMIFINQRNVIKKGYSWHDLINGIDQSSPSISWTSTYGSVTFNPFGKEFPDGGMNEKGLYIWEMSLSETVFPVDNNKPTMFMVQWMQYQLDNFSTVDEVLEYLDRICLDGWEWHFFIADKSGKKATIEFIDQKAIVHTDDNMPEALLCNTQYSEEMKWLRQHKGFGGEIPIDQNDVKLSRFIRGADLIQNFSTQNPVDYSFKTLTDMSPNVRWSIVIDVTDMTIYFNTNLNQNVRYFTLKPEDFSSPDGTLMLDIECPGPENIREEFTLYDPDKDKELIHRNLKLLVDMDSGIAGKLKRRKRTINDMVEDMFSATGQPSELNSNLLSGEWNGTITYPAAKGKYIKMNVTTVYKQEGNRLTGKINDGELLKDLPIFNGEARAGLISFAVKDPNSGYILNFNLSNNTKKIKGSFEISKESEKRQGEIFLNR